ncbi:MAG: signal peptide peptidase SppA [Rhodospirillaceae bacterium]|jgi:protease-4|nr:signal peptide peptidase SppA [Rhodospirillaceae bacterium]MBT3809466.1 signal peptide peptidase SppA [Rhodospirillaceae bacterium]MBT3930814.1 signal peptide peptidase SppA [Rhodospirillaceae bacterium]MBT4772986.1 signal peptide peptidase SppA [Rhodospirillaceae bacterium]MBT5359367.1 signal peptide peptidase SppA [Rhodospirillaceae bacterium]
MSYDADALLDRRRLKRRLRVWQAVTLLVVVGAILTFLQTQGNLFRGERIVRIHVEGIIVRDDARRRTLARLAKDDDVRGVIVHVDSPGGSVVGGEDLYNSLRAIAETKPVATVMGTVATSAAYMTAIATDRIFAREGTITGSIGVILQTANVSELLGRIGIEPITIKSTALKGVPSPVEPLTPEGRAATEQVVLDLYDFFVDLVIERRPIDAGAVRLLADGRVFSGRQAVQNNLIDAIGDEAAAIDWMVREHDLPGGLPVETLRTSPDEDGLLEKITGLAGKSLFSNALTLDGLVSLWQPSPR